jgi:S1-C subfamily serine protease
MTDWTVPPSARPKPEDYAYDLDAALSAIVGVHAMIPSDAFTAETLGTERGGHGVLIRENGLVLTIGYLITEAETIWLTLSDGRTVQGHALAYDQETGFGFVQMLARMKHPVMPIGDSHAAQLGERVVVGGAGGRDRSIAARIVAKQEFAGYWEYVLDEAIFTAPAHPHWGGAAVIGPKGDLIGLGSLQLEHAREGGKSMPLNMVVPINLLKPIYNDMLTRGRPDRPPRPWLGLYATEMDDKVVIVGLADGGPAQQADLHTGDMVLEVAGNPVDDLASLFRAVWALGSAGVNVPLSIFRDGETLNVSVTSSDRNRFLRTPSVH